MTDKVITRQLQYLCVLPIATGGRFVQGSPLKGRITGLTAHFPAGCVNLVDLVVGHSSIRCFPQNGAIALDDAAPTFALDEPVERSEPIWVEVWNGDAAFPHTIQAILTIQGWWS